MKGKNMSALKTTDHSFQTDVLQADKTVLVDFWAEWCGPCRMISPLLDEIAEELKDEVIIAKINIDDNPDVPAQLGIRSIPTLMVFKNGEAVGTKVGVQTKSTLIDWVRSVS